MDESAIATQILHSQINEIDLTLGKERTCASTAHQRTAKAVSSICQRLSFKFEFNMLYVYYNLLATGVRHFLLNIAIINQIQKFFGYGKPHRDEQTVDPATCAG